MGKISNIINKVKDFLDIWLDPEKETYSIEEECKKYHISPESAQLLLMTYNGLPWTGYSEKEKVETKKKTNKGKDLVRTNNETHEKYEQQQERSQEDSNNLERE